MNNHLAQVFKNNQALFSDRPPPVPFTKTPNDYLERVFSFPLSGSEQRFMSVIERNTFGFHRNRVAMRLKSIGRLTGDKNPWRTKTRLVCMGLLDQEKRGVNSTITFSINCNFDQWSAPGQSLYKQRLKARNDRIKAEKTARAVMLMPIITPKKPKRVPECSKGSIQPCIDPTYIVNKKALKNIGDTKTAVPNGKPKKPALALVKKTEKNTKGGPGGPANLNKPASKGSNLPQGTFPGGWTTPPATKERKAEMKALRSISEEKQERFLRDQSNTAHNSKNIVVDFDK